MESKEQEVSIFEPSKDEVVEVQKDANEGLVDPTITEKNEQKLEVFKIHIKTPVELGTIEVQVTRLDTISDIYKYLQETTETCLHTSYSLMLNGIKLNEFLEIGSIAEIVEGSVLEMVPTPYNERTARLHVKRLRDVISTGQEDISSTNPSLFSCYSFTDNNEVEIELQNKLVEEWNQRMAEEEEFLKQQQQQQQQQNGENNQQPQAATTTAPAPSPAPVTPAAPTTTTTTTKETSTDKNKKSKVAKPISKKEQQKKELSEKLSAERKKEIVVIGEPTQKPSLANFYPKTFRESTQCYRRLNMSGWNPVPGHRKLVGDLFYLEAELMESRETIFITANVNGFFINASTSTTFNPEESTRTPIHSHNLHQLLQRASPLFSRALKTVLSSITQRHPYELVPAVVPNHPWVVRPQTYRFDPAHADDTPLLLNDPDLRAQPRDWNEELQSLRELPKSTIHERILRDRAFVKVNSDFVDAAIKGAQVVVSKSIPPINPLENERSHMFVYNNIFFSFALDTRNSYANCGGDRAARLAANNDLKGVKLFNLIDIEGISTICTAIIDFRGHRVIAQSLVPGILSNENTSVVKYGSMDSGQTIKADPEFHEKLTKIGALLHLAPREVIPSGTDQQTVTICTSFESKGIVGTDGRKYVLDILRATPRDPNYPEASHQMYLLRPELIANYTEYLKMEWQDKQLKKKIEAEKAKKQQQQEQGEEVKEQKQEEEVVAEEEQEPQILFNPNSFPIYGVELGGTQEEKDKDMTELTMIGKFLKEKMIKRLVEDFKLYNSTPVDGQTLTAIMHSRGINMRYLGYISNQSEKIPFVRELCFNEMVSRAAKHIFNDILRTTSPSELASGISHFLNCFLGTDTGNGVLANGDNNNSSVTTKSNKKGQSSNNNTQQQVKKPTQQSLWNSIATSIKDKYNFEITTHSVPLESRVSVLRALSLKTGLQILAKEYDFTKDEPFCSSDIIDMVCVVKHLNPRSPDGIDLLEFGKAKLASKRIEQAVELLSEALSVCHQVHGAIHNDTANCYSNLAMAAFHNNNYEDAIQQQKSSLIITEKTLGADHHDTIHSYNNLALFCQRAGRHSEAMGYLKHVLYLSDLLGSEFSPERPSIYISVAIVLQELQEFELAIKYLLRAIEHQSSLFGEGHLISTSPLHSISLIYAQLGQWREAIDYETQALTILKKFLQEGHIRIKESEDYIKHFQMESKNEQEIKRLQKLQQQKLVQLQLQQQQQQQQQQLQKQQQQQAKKNESATTSGKTSKKSSSTVKTLSPNDSIETILAAFKNTEKKKK